MKTNWEHYESVFIAEETTKKQVNMVSCDFRRNVLKYPCWKLRSLKHQRITDYILDINCDECDKSIAKWLNQEYKKEDVDYNETPNKKQYHLAMGTEVQVSMDGKTWYTKIFHHKDKEKNVYYCYVSGYEGDDRVIIPWKYLRFCLKKGALNYLINLQK